MQGRITKSPGAFPWQKHYINEATCLPVLLHPTTLTFGEPENGYYGFGPFSRSLNMDPHAGDHIPSILAV